jgi:hypothetical protein
MSWYDVSVGPNLAAYNHVRKTARPEIANQQYAVIAPTLHCAYTRATENTVVGERSMGDARLNYSELTWGLVRPLPQGRAERPLEKMPKVRLLHDGHQPMAVVGYVAAGWRAAYELLPVEWREGEYAQWRRRAERCSSDRG